MRKYYQYLFFLSVLLLQLFVAKAQFTLPKTDSWKTAQETKKASIACLWYNIEPFIYRSKENKIIGVEYELMEGFKEFLQEQYNIDLQINWVDAKTFENIFPYIKQSKEMGLFGLSFYSITNERKNEVKFSPPYMPDLNIVCTNNNLPTYTNNESFAKDLSKMKAFTMRQTTMEQDLIALKNKFYSNLTIVNKVDDYEVLKSIAQYQNAIGYVPVSVYVVALQRGLKIKRQRILATRREGFAAIYTKNSDWDNPINTYFTSSQCKVLVNRLIKKYLGEEVTNIVLNVSVNDTINGKPSDIELLTKEREIVTKRLIDTALVSQQQEQQKVIYIAIIFGLVIIGTALYNRFRINKKLSNTLQQQNNIIANQKEKIELMNTQLQIKILQSKLNPHFLFNSLNAIQFFVTEGNNKATLQYINKFSLFLRNVLKSSDTIGIAAYEEANLLEQYLWLEQHRFTGKFEYEIKKDSNTDAYIIPPLITISLIEHILYKSILASDVAVAKKISIHFKEQNNQVLVSITDNGIALQTNNEFSTNIVDRLFLMNASVKDTIVFNYQKTEVGNITNLLIK